jgi:hypothetical protein
MQFVWYEKAISQRGVEPRQTAIAGAGRCNGPRLEPGAAPPSFACEAFSIRRENLGPPMGGRREDRLFPTPPCRRTTIAPRPRARQRLRRRPENFRAPSTGDAGRGGRCSRGGPAAAAPREPLPRKNYHALVPNLSVGTPLSTPRRAGSEMAWKMGRVAGRAAVRGPQAPAPSATVRRVVRCLGLLGFSHRSATSPSRRRILPTSAFLRGARTEARPSPIPAGGPRSWSDRPRSATRDFPGERPTSTPPGLPGA